jgi:plastocyanin
MKFRRPIALLATAVSIVALVFVVSCGSDNNNSGGGGVQPRELDSGNIPPGGVYQHTFAGAGTFNYHCQIHSGMNGQVIVVNGSADSMLVTIGPGNAFNPTPATVKPGGYVRWINAGSTHTVTSN